MRYPFKIVDLMVTPVLCLSLCQVAGANSRNEQATARPRFRVVVNVDYAYRLAEQITALEPYGVSRAVSEIRQLLVNVPVEQKNEILVHLLDRTLAANTMNFTFYRHQAILDFARMLNPGLENNPATTAQVLQILYGHGSYGPRLMEVLDILAPHFEQVAAPELLADLRGLIVSGLTTWAREEQVKPLELTPAYLYLLNHAPLAEFRVVFGQIVRKAHNKPFMAISPAEKLLIDRLVTLVEAGEISATDLIDLLLVATPRFLFLVELRKATAWRPDYELAINYRLMRIAELELVRAIREHSGRRLESYSEDLLLDALEDLRERIPMAEFAELIRKVVARTRGFQQDPARLMERFLRYDAVLGTGEVNRDPGLRCRPLLMSRTLRGM